MAMADSVPGVSGGTIAFIMGFYDQFIDSLEALIHGKKEAKIKAIKFLAMIAIGWVVGMGIAVVILDKVFAEHIYAISSLFLGFIIGAIPIIIHEEKAVLKGKYLNLIFTLVGIALVVAITFLNPNNSGDGGAFTYNLQNIVFLFVSGAIAICAMILPGISGSTLLLIFGTYMTVINAVSGLVHLDFSGFMICVIFGLGVLTGIALIISALKKVLKSYRSATIYCILGLMIGSLYAVVQGPLSLDTPKPAMTIDSFSIVFFIIGIGVIAGLQALKVVMQKAQDKKAVKADTEKPTTIEKEAEKKA